MHYVHGNVRSLFNKYLKLKQYLLDSNISVLGLSKTWLTKNIPNAMLFIPSYQLVRLDRNWTNANGQVKKGGGVCCYIDMNLIYLYSDLEQLNCSTQEG